MAGALQKRGHDLLLACQPGSDILARAAPRHCDEEVRMRQDYDVLAARQVSMLLKKYKTTSFMPSIPPPTPMV